MKRCVFVCLLVLLLVGVAVLTAAPVEPVQQGAVRVAEVDGTPDGRLVRYFKFQNGSVTLSGDTVTINPGYSQLVTSTTVTLTAAQCGATIVNDSADVLTLPEASTVLGCEYTFVVNNASNLDINPNDATDIILPFVNAIATDPTLISPAAGDAIRCATVGGSITLRAVSANNWVVVGGVAGHGWSDIN